MNLVLRGVYKAARWIVVTVKSFNCSHFFLAEREKSWERVNGDSGIALKSFIIHKCCVQVMLCAVNIFFIFLKKLPLRVAALKVMMLKACPVR